MLKYVVLVENPDTDEDENAASQEFGLFSHPARGEEPVAQDQADPGETEGNHADNYYGQEDGDFEGGQAESNGRLARRVRSNCDRSRSTCDSNRSASAAEPAARSR